MYLGTSENQIHSCTVMPMTLISEIGAKDPYQKTGRPTTNQHKNRAFYYSLPETLGAGQTR